MSTPFTIIKGNCIDVMRGMEPASVDSVVTDPPYGIRFMGKAWDGADIERRHADRQGAASADPTCTENGGHKSAAAEAGKYDLSPKAMLAFQAFSRAWAAEAFRVLKPGGYLLAFASTRTYHRMVCGVEEAGFEIRDQIGWCFGSGFPKSHNLDGEFEGWGTALKPAWEPIVVARKPLEGTVAQNMAAHGTGALHIAACRVGEEVRTAAFTSFAACSNNALGAPGTAEARRGTQGEAKEYVGRWPANLIHDGSPEVVAAFPEAPGQQGEISTDTTRRLGQNTYEGLARGRGAEKSANSENAGAVGFKMRPGARRIDSGSAARFFYCAKASREDRNEGLGSSDTPAVSAGATMGDRERADWEARNGNHHPTVKPTALMAYLVRLVTQRGGKVLDPFNGSGSTGKGAVREGVEYIGIELDDDGEGKPMGYIDITNARIAFEAARVYAASAQGGLFEELDHA